ncbi:hypothetical protein [Endozoicomonas atrinae]|uniref:hypothetical protein n=1 Tax=Endozoicomonas atrinae TaxID=1333660 RepID=UPI003B0032FB
MELPEATKSLASRTTTPLDSFSKERKTPTLSARERLSSSKAHDTLPNEELCRNLQALFLNTEGGAFFNDERRAITSFDEQRFFQPDSSGKFTSSRRNRELTNYETIKKQYSLWEENDSTSTQACSSPLSTTHNSHLTPPLKSTDRLGLERSRPKFRSNDPSAARRPPMLST